MNERTRRILVVDDHILNRNLLKRRLLKENFEVIEAENGDLALEEISKQKPDLVLLDIIMPGIDGNEVLSTIRKTYNYYELPVIMVTSKEENEDIVKSFTIGANDYITKPVRMSIASARINTQLKLAESFQEYKELIELKQIRKNSEQISDMFGHISHEINNPLTVVKGNLQLLSGFKDKLNPEKVISLTEQTKEAISRIGVFFESIKPFIDTTSTSTDNASSEVKLGDFLHFLDNPPNKLSAMKLEISNSLDEKVLLKIGAKEIQRVLTIILHNAYDALEAINSLSSPVKISLSAKGGDDLIITVSNSGVPIPENITPMIFDPFFTTKEVGKGVGIGLTEARSILEKNNASINLDHSNVDETCFSIALKYLKEGE